MCNKCINFKWTHPEYNFCPMCGKQIKEIVFISRFKTVVDYKLQNRIPHFVENRIKR